MEEVLTDWEQLLSSSTPPPPPPPPATTLTITSYTSHDPFLTVFPPVNHEGLPVAPPLANSHHHDPPSATSAGATSSPSPPFSLPTDFRTCDSTTHKLSLYSRSRSPISPESPIARWIGFSLQVLNSKVVPFFSNIRSRVLQLSYPSESSVPISGLMAGASLTGLGIWIWWRRRRRRPRGRRDDTIEHLNLLIREKDEKIIELLLQVGQLNKLLLARYRVPVAREH